MSEKSESPPVGEAGLPKNLEELLGFSQADRRRLAEAIAAWAEPMQAYPQRLMEVMAPVAESFSQFAEGLKAAFERIAPTVQLFADALKNAPPLVREALKELAGRGWYIDMDGMGLSEPIELLRMLQDGQTEEVENALVRHFELHLQRIEESLCARFPRRAKILSAAFGAHRRGEFELSVPVLLTQVDGVCREIAGGHLFRGKDGKDAIAAFVRDASDWGFGLALRSPLLDWLPIARTERHRDPASTELNRHTVLHGECTDYGTKVNSLKTVSLLNYVAWVLHDGDRGEMTADG